MKALLEKHVRALELRKKGWSYSAIKKELGIAKSTASVWLNKYPLTHEQLDKLQFHSEHRIESFRATMAKKKQKLLDVAVTNQIKAIGKLTEKELYLCGLALYWGEGAKTRYTELGFSNTDPRMIRFYLQWLKVCVKFPIDLVKVRLHLYRDMDIKHETDYWMNTLGLKIYNFKKPYIKPTTLKGLTYKSRGHGTCNVIASGLKFSRPALAGMEVLASMY
ncbi:helix-turn-helix domain-containing protein [Candidatus Woesebacteria bacterium]|nr:helix-turn-helix domain-containing protein [Candidatus Woesebacteria bacterium]